MAAMNDDVRRRAEAEATLASPEVRSLAEQLCDIGRRLWQREYVEGNAGNITVRLPGGGDLLLCTPSLVSKGFMRPEDMCVVDLNGRQLAGTRRRTSEILLHTRIMQAQPGAASCVHCHAPYATAYAVAGVAPPSGYLSEVELFVGEIALARYATPGSPEVAAAVAPLAVDHPVVLMANHGVVSWGGSVEEAYFRIEIVEAYLRTMAIAAHIGNGPRALSALELEALLAVKARFGLDDPRLRRDTERCG